MLARCIQCSENVNLLSYNSTLIKLLKINSASYTKSFLETENHGVPGTSIGLFICSRNSNVRFTYERVFQVAITIHVCFKWQCEHFLFPKSTIVSFDFIVSVKQYILNSFIEAKPNIDWEQEFVLLLFLQSGLMGQIHTTFHGLLWHGASFQNHTHTRSVKLRLTCC